MSDTFIDKEKAIEIAQKYKALVAKHLPLKALYLYGSYSKDNHTRRTATLTLPLSWNT